MLLPRVHWGQFVVERVSLISLEDGLSWLHLPDVGQVIAIPQRFIPLDQSFLFFDIVCQDLPQLLVSWSCLLGLLMRGKYV